MRIKHIPNHFKLPLVMLLAAALLSACGSGGLAEEAALAEPEAAQPQPEAEQAEPVEESVEEPAQASGGYQLGFEPGDPNLKASDATKASLQAGKPQFIDFFAFW